MHICVFNKRRHPQEDKFVFKKHLKPPFSLVTLIIWTFNAKSLSTCISAILKKGLIKTYVTNVYI